MDQVVLSVRMKGDKEGPQTGDVVLEGGAITNWAPGEFYKKDSVFTYGDQLWRATEDFTAGTTFNTDHCVKLGKADIVLRNFQPNTVVEKDNIVTNDGKLYRAKNSFTTGETFNAADWDLIGGGAYTFQSTDGTVNVIVSSDGKIIDFSIDDTLDNYVEKVAGKGLSTNDYTNAEKTKLGSVEEGAQRNLANTVTDPDYVHTDNNFTNTDKENLNNKRDKVTGANKVYTVNAAGAQASSSFTTTPTASAFPVWTSNRTLKGADPVDNNDLTNKSYVTAVREEIEDEFNKPFVKDFEPKITASTLEFTKTFENIKTSATTTEDIALPVASGTQAGVMNPAIYNAIQNSADKIDAMLNGSVSIASLPGAPTQAELTAAWKMATGKDEVFNQAGIFDSTNNKIWTYYTNDNTWHYVNAGGATVAQWGTGVAGIVTGVADTPANRGRMFAEADGTASLIGYDNHETRITTNEGDIDNLEEDIEEIRDILDDKVDKTSSTYQVYATNASGAQTTIQYSTDKTANSIARRIGNGRLVVGEPVNNTDATTKKYVDDQFEKVVFWDDPSTPVTPDPWITTDDITDSVLNMFAYKPGETLVINQCILCGTIVTSGGKQRWSLPLTKSLALISGITVTLTNSANSYFFRVVRNEESNMSGRPATGAASNVEKTESGINFECNLTDSSGNVHLYDLAIGTFGTIKIVFS